MRVVLLGAGASYGSKSVAPGLPPLGSQLFDSLQSAFPTSWGTIEDDLMDQFVESFEAGMGALLASGSHAVPVLMQQMAMFFARFRPAADNVYAKLIERLQSVAKLDDTVFASLNYECLLELALSAAGRGVDYFGQRPGTDRSLVWKLHGSCNFLPGPEITATRGVSFGAGVSFNTSILPVDPSQVAAYCQGNTALYPAMAHYAPGKAVQIAQPVIQQVQNAYIETVGKAESVAVVGVRPNMDDGHIWRPLSTTLARVLLVGDEGAIHEWTMANRAGRATEYLAPSFEAGVQVLADQL